MIKSVVFLLTLIVASSTVLGHPSDTSTAVKRPYDVLSYKLLLDWRQMFELKSTVFSGTNEITMVLTDSVSEIVLDAAEMKIDLVTVNGTALPTTPQPQSELLHIPLTKDLQHKGTSLDLQIAYSHTRAQNPTPPTGGQFFYPKGLFVGFGAAHDSVFVEEDLAYTMSEPLDAHRWMPCNDEPYDKANSEISIVVPKSYSAQSNGTLQSVDTNTDSSLIFHWKSDRPISTYLMCADASHWIEWKDQYVRLSNPLDTVPVIYFAWPPDYNASDTTGIAHNARYSFRNTPRMMANDSRLFGEYPFKQYGQVPLQPFGFGGMEHQTMTSIDRSILHGTNEDVIAHELFHQWFGDKTTCETWADIWLNEGFATMGEAVWEEAAYGHSAYISTVQRQASEFFNPHNGNVNNVPVYNPAVDQMFGADVLTVYNKPGCVLHMLRQILGDTAFFNTLRDYSNAFAYTTANTYQFRDFLDQRAGANSPIDLFTFINQWIFQPDWPVYSFTWTQNASHKLILHVQQSQDSTDHYTMPIHFSAVSGTDTIPLTFINNARSQFFSASLDRPIDTLIFDQNAVILSQFTETRDDRLAGVASQANATSALRVYTANGYVKLSFAPIVSEGADLRVMDVLGRVVFEQGISAGDASLSVPERNLPNGDYFALLMDGTRHVSVRFQIVQ